MLCFGEERPSLPVEMRRDALKAYLTQKRCKNEHRKLDEVMKSHGAVSECEPFGEGDVRANIRDILWGTMDFNGYHALFSHLLPLGNEPYLNDER